MLCQGVEDDVLLCGPDHTLFQQISSSMELDDFNCWGMNSDLELKPLASQCAHNSPSSVGFGKLPAKRMRCTQDGSADVIPTAKDGSTNVILSAKEGSTDLILPTIEGSKDVVLPSTDRSATGITPAEIHGSRQREEMRSSPLSDLRASKPATHHERLDDEIKLHRPDLEASQGNRVEPDIAPRRRTWSAQEDKAICELVAAHGQDFATVSSFLPGRTADAVSAIDSHAPEFKPLA